MASGGIVLAATPIGNPADASTRLLELLATAPIVAAEDTRRLRALTKRLGVAPAGRIVSLHDFNERDRSGELVEAALGGALVLVVSDAGTPLICDPGYVTVRAAIAAGVPVTVAPGPSAALAALAVSGLAVDRFCFEGFWPRRAAERAARMAELAAERRTAVLFESPRRLAATLSELAAELGAGRRAVVCHELTKVHEEVLRGSLSELAAWAAGSEVLGEIVVVVEGAAPNARSLDELAADVLARAEAGERLSAAAAAVARSAGVSRRDLYAQALARRG